MVRRRRLEKELRQPDQASSWEEVEEASSFLRDPAILLAMGMALPA